ncbi:MAG: 1-acyl-sn-glycerol-3-phosphate acyltransferase [Tannerella sp.]|jgi:1-acyl-sn-glycerol-3-phosphate acyltransferase|nr:1-acyl-sn-glycerol-3-phosphate acyltransferase [Tannerella sp.]
MTDFIVSIFTRCAAHRKLLAGLSALLTLAFALALPMMEYREDIAEFLPGNSENERIGAIYRHIGNSSRLTVFFSQKDSTQRDAARIIEAMDLFTARLQQNDSLHVVPEIIARTDESRLSELMDFIRDNVPCFLTENDYRRIDSLLTDEYIASCLKTDKQLLTLPSSAMMKDHIVNDPLHLFTPLWQELNTFGAGESRELNDGYIFSSDGRKGTVIVTSPYGVSESNGNTALLALIDRTAKQVEASFPDMQISCFGAPAIAVSNADRIKRDSLLAVSLSVLLILMLLIYFFRNLRHILLVFFSVLFGWLFALTLLALCKGSISVIALGISSVFIGIAINYPLHFIDRTRHQPRVGQALKEIAAPLLIGNITTVSAFLSLVFIRSNAMQDMGLFGSLLLVGTILFVLIFLPHLVRRETCRSKVRGFGDSKIFDRFASFAPERNRWIMWSVLILTCVFLYLSRFTAFEPDMNAISYMTGRQREDMRYMMQFIEKRDRDVVYLVSEGATLDDALAASEQNAWLLDTLRRRGWIESVSGTGVFLASGAEQQRRIDRWNAFRQSRGEWLLQQLDVYGRAEGFREGAFEPFRRLLARDFTVQDETFFAPLALPAENYIVRDEGRHMLVQLLYCDRDRTVALEEAIRNGAENAFAFDSRDIGQRMVDSLSDDFNYVLFICGFIVFLFLTVSFGRLELSLMTFLPLVVGWIWILGIMQLAGMRFNIVNIILATFIFGQGDDYTIFIADGLICEYAFRRRMLASHKRSIILSSLIMFSGIGTLVFAKHPALHSLAEVTIVGMFSVVAMAYIIPPFIFRRLTQRKDGGYREVPVTCRRALYSVYSFAAFLVGSALITATGFFLFAFGKKTEKRRLRYHALLCRVSRFVVRRIPGVKFRLDNLSHETFEQPAVIIANHQSHLDLMCLLMLAPRLVILTNDWVWNNPFYGRLIRYADFYPVSGGMERCIDKLADRMRNGYSIVIFPEGTRSDDSSVLRFHRGAFYLAERLKADILPVFLHGVGDVLPRKDFMLREGRITVEIHPRIAADDARYGADYVARTKRIRQWFGEQFGAMCARLQDARYYRSFVMHNYYYKGAAVERSVSAALKKTDCFARWINVHRGCGCVLVVNGGFGEFAFLFALVHRQCRVTAVDRDEDRTALARGCAGLPPNLHVCLETDLPADATFDTVYLLRPDSVQKETYGRYNPVIIDV